MEGDLRKVLQQMGGGVRQRSCPPQMTKILLPEGIHTIRSPQGDLPPNI